MESVCWPDGLHSPKKNIRHILAEMCKKIHGVITEKYSTTNTKHDKIRSEMFNLFKWIHLKATCFAVDDMLSADCR
jgi:hypothetical protein